MIIKKIKENKACPPSRKVGSRRGFVLLFAVTLAAILLSIALGVSQIALKELKFSISAADTNNAFFSADIGAECALYNDRSDQNKFPIGGGVLPFSCVGAPVSITQASNIWILKISGLGTASKSCAIVTVDKSSSSLTIITSKGYSTGGDVSGACNPTTNATERELDTTYGETTILSDGSGGIITHSGGFTTHTFTSSGTFVAPSTGGTVAVLVVAGGGGGGDGVSYANNGGGGGGGGVVYNASFSVIANQTYTVNVGSGGLKDVNGGDSVFANITATGGGKGGLNSIGGNGGSGGGGAAITNWAGGLASPAGQGNNGAKGTVVGGKNPGGGGGGAGQAGNANGLGYGGNGVANSITGSPIIYAGGGSAGNDGGRIAGGSGGGGSGAVYTDATGGGVGVANTGGGGGGGASRLANVAGGSGGSGVVIVRYVTGP